VEREEEKRRFITNYFVNLIRSSMVADSRQLTQAVERKVTAVMNFSLLKDFTEAEVVESLNAIGDLKAPGPDGMPSVFYKKFWEVVGIKVTNEVMQVLNGGQIPDGWNETTIVLIPKVKNPQKVKIPCLLAYVMCFTRLSQRCSQID
jgi:hypothetical protein